MSWIKRRGQTTPSPAPAPPVQMYNPNQHTGENQWQQGAGNWYNQPYQAKPEPQQAQNYWQQQPQLPPQPQQHRQQPQPQQQYQAPQTYNQNQFPQYQDPSGYFQNNTTYQQPQQPQNFGNVQYTQQYNQNNELQTGQNSEDAWNWGWGDEDNNLQNNLAQNQSHQVQQPQENSVEEAWNWGEEQENPQKEKEKEMEITNKHLDILGKRNKLETPQWSVESQMSQESSDDILHTSESDKSHGISRSSTISHSPIDPPVEAEDRHENKEILKQEVLKPNPTPPPPKNTQTPPLASVDGGNPYKRTSGISYKAMFRNTSTPPQVFSQSVNLETVPDNSEQPDQIPQPQKVVQQWAENNETPCDRNQYLETGQLSDLPPPGLRRMVLGQKDEAAGGSDEPPPGLSRMVLGQTEAVAASADEPQRMRFEPPEGLHRMVPGESSSPESTLRHQQQRLEEDSEPEFNQLGNCNPQARSATIGADTPPVQQFSNDGASQVGADRKSNKSDSSSNRRHSIEGQNQEVSKLAGAVRNLTVGENLTDGQTSNTSVHESSGRRHSRQESSDSENEPKKLARNYRDKRYGDKTKGRDRDRERERDRYTPEKKFDKKHYRERRYEEDTDYYSDKEKDRRRDDRDREYERKYSSLRKDKPRRREGRDPRDYRDYRDDRRRDYYRYEEDYVDENRSSRPTSRTDSMLDSYRERGDPRDRRHRERDRERDRYRRHRDHDPYNPYQGFAYDPYNPYYQQYQYYENLRRTNPQAYAEWYRKYYQQATGHSGFGGDDRASVHSGRSSANDELVKDRYNRQSYYSQSSLPHMGGYYGDSNSHSVSGHYGFESSSFANRTIDNTDSALNFEEPKLQAQRLTPAKFATAHIKASISSGKLLRILPTYPMDGQNATVEICSLQSFLADDEEFQELNEFPGPLLKGVTHKKTIIEYCEKKIKGAKLNDEITDPDSYILMWELLILLIRQNGMVVGTDIAELLLKNSKTSLDLGRPSSVLSNLSSTAEAQADSQAEATNGSLSYGKEEDVTNKFREFLLYGSGKEALEWAMKNGLWGHALFLASKLDKRTYANVMMRFANGLTINDPLQTLYQLLSGRMPAAVTCVADEKWGDWRPHLAMILSNSTQRPELNCKAITTLGDTLLHRGSLYAAQFCYLMAEVGFGKHDDPTTKLCLLGADLSKPFSQFATNEAIHMTEIYEYACGLNDAFIIPEFQVYKYLLATRLADRGLLEKSLAYLEKISSYIVANPGSVQAKLVEDVCRLGDKLKFYDPSGDLDDEDVNLDMSRPDHSWLKDIKDVLNDLKNGVIRQESLGYGGGFVENQQWEGSQNYQQQQQVQEQWQPEQVSQVEYQQNTQAQELDYGSQYNSAEQQQYSWNAQQQQWTEQTNQSQFQPEPQEQHFGGNPEDVPALPQISMPNQPKGKSPFDDEPLPQEKVQKSPEKPKVQPQSEKQSTGWFGGIFSKLSMKPKNQMKLPDDKNPKIVWDQDKKKWVNLDDDGNDAGADLKPPPKMSEIIPKPQLPQSASFPAPAPINQPQFEAKQAPQVPPSQSMPSIGETPNIKSSSNMFKLQRSRNLKKSYVDVFNPNGSTGSSSAPPEPFTPLQNQMNYFVPQPVHDPNAPTDFLTPAPPMPVEQPEN